ncbi:MAG: aldolase/citrate lyase family protein [Rhodoferax sp.]|nr:aldolase/citrate lyase family protein [Rhodoferax sp.]
MQHPRDILLGAQGAAGVLPVCDHYSGVEARMVKSLQMQADMTVEFGACVFDVTLDCEDGAPIGGEREQAQLIASLAQAAHQTPVLVQRGLGRRVGVRVHAVTHPAFMQDVACVVGEAAHALSYIMVPKVESPADVEAAVRAIDALGPVAAALPVHVLIESAAAVHRAFDIAAHPRVESLSFGLMDFVSSHGGAIPASAMGVRPPIDADALDQFHHPLVVRAKTEISSACHAFGKVPSHGVVTEFKDVQALHRSARYAAQALGYTRMWSIHPDQIRPIVRAFAPDAGAVEQAADVVLRAANADWAPVSVGGVLHDRASYRFFWQVLERAHATGVALPAEVSGYFTPEGTGAGAGAC